MFLYSCIIYINKKKIPFIKNYLGYTINDTQTYPGICDFVGSKQYVFPDWDEDINKYASGTLTFGQIIISDFLRLTPTQKDPTTDEYIFPNDARELTSC